MSDLVERVARAIAPCDKVEGWGRCEVVCPACDENSRAAIAAVAEWLRQELSVDEHEPYVAAALMKQLEQPK